MKCSHKHLSVYGRVCAKCVDDLLKARDQEVARLKRDLAEADIRAAAWRDQYDSLWALVTAED